MERVETFLGIPKHEIGKIGQGKSKPGKQITIATIQILVHDSARNKLILQDITYELNNGKRVVIITERKEHIDSLYQ